MYQPCRKHIIARVSTFKVPSISTLDTFLAFSALRSGANRATPGGREFALSFAEEEWPGYDKHFGDAGKIPIISYCRVRQHMQNINWICIQDIFWHTSWIYTNAAPGAIFWGAVNWHSALEVRIQHFEREVQMYLFILETRGQRVPFPCTSSLNGSNNFHVHGALSVHVRIPLKTGLLHWRIRYVMGLLFAARSLFSASH